MKILLLPVNIASDISHKVRALQYLGVNARGFTLASSVIQTADNIESFQLDYAPGKVAHLSRLWTYTKMWRLISRADVLHWVSDANIFSQKWHFKFLRRINKPGVVQWMGSDIRIPEMDFAINPFYRSVFENGYEYRATESAEISRTNQEFARELNFYPLELVGTEHYINHELFPKRFRTRQSVVLADHHPRYPDADNKRPLVVHSPSAPVAKGTQYIVDAVERLRKKYDFDFRLVENVERREALNIMSQCDVFIDQLILGSHGYAAVEAMAFGKPVVCYINPVMGKDYPVDLPIINANPDNIEPVLEKLLINASLRHEQGRKSRAYAEKYHNDQKNARELVSIYEEVIEAHRAGRERK